MKSLWQHGDTIIGEEVAATLGTNRARIDWRGSRDNIQFLVSYDVEWLTGSYLSSDQYEVQRSLETPPYWELQHSYWIDSKNILSHGVYRGYVNARLDRVDLRVGRQQLNWSETFLWSTLDRFNPYRPLQIEPEERQGVDGVRAIWSLPGQSALEMVAVGRHDSNQFGARYRTHLGRTDVHLAVADYGDTDALGVSTSGQFKGAGVRMEASRNFRKDESEYNDLVVGVDYTFADQMRIVGEFLYRGDGATTTAEYDVSALLSGERSELAQRYVGVVVQKGYEPLVSIDVMTLVNLDDSSWAVLPAVRYSPGRFQDMHLRAGIQWFRGDAGTEYGEAPNTVFTEIEWYF